MELLIGCGNSREKLLSLNGGKDWKGLVTLDINPDVKPDVVHDLNILPYPFESDTFDEIHAYSVLEHIGSQGDYRAFLGQFSELWRILKDGGVLMGTVPDMASPWLWADPGHRRLISNKTLTFLSQKQYELQKGNTPMTDYRDIYKADFDLIYSSSRDGKYIFALKAVKTKNGGNK